MSNDTDDKPVQEAPEPWNKEFNHAIRRVADVINPRGYELMDEMPEDTSEWDYLREHGRPVILREDGPDFTLLGDVEIEQSLRAAIGTLIYKHGDHIAEGGAPIEAIVGAVDTISDRLVSLYGVTDVSDLWRKALYISVLATLSARLGNVEPSMKTHESLLRMVRDEQIVQAPVYRVRGATVYGLQAMEQMRLMHNKWQAARDNPTYEGVPHISKETVH